MKPPPALSDVESADDPLMVNHNLSENADQTLLKTVAENRETPQEMNNSSAEGAGLSHHQLLSTDSESPEKVATELPPVSPPIAILTTNSTQPLGTAKKTKKAIRFTGDYHYWLLHSTLFNLSRAECRNLSSNRTRARNL